MKNRDNPIYQQIKVVQSLTSEYEGTLAHTYGEAVEMATMEVKDMSYRELKAAYDALEAPTPVQTAAQPSKCTCGSVPQIARYPEMAYESLRPLVMRCPACYLSVEIFASKRVPLSDAEKDVTRKWNAAMISGGARFRPLACRHGCGPCHESLGPWHEKDCQDWREQP